MNQDVYTKLYVKAVQEEDQEFQNFLEDISSELRTKTETITRLLKELEECNKENEEILERSDKIILLMKKHPDKVERLYQAWDHDFIIPKEEDL